MYVFTGLTVIPHTSDSIQLLGELSVSVLKGDLRLLESPPLDLDLFKDLASVEILAQLTVLSHWPFKQLTKLGDNFMDDALGRTVGLFHGEVLLFKLIDFSLEVEVLLLLHDLSLFRSSVILGKQALSFVVDEVAEHLK